MSVSYGKGSKGKATKLHSELVRSIGYCENCGSTQNLQAAHIVGRKYSATRTLICNAYCLCASCHRRYTDWPRDFSHFITTTPAQKYYDEMAFIAKSNNKVDWDERLEILKSYKDMRVEDMRERDYQFMREKY